MKFTGSNRIPSDAKDRMVLQRFGTWGNLAPFRGRNVTPPELCLPGPFDAVGYPPTLAAYPSTGEFEQALLYEYGPAQVGFRRLGILRRRHRLRLGRRYLRLTPHAERGNGLFLPNYLCYSP